jgi:hypothetical protein
MEEMRFIGREDEMSILESEYGNRCSFVLMTGRRRIGKTRLIKEFLKGKDSMYFYCNNVNSALMLQEFSSKLSEYAGRTYGAFSDWREAFKAFSECKEGKKILAIDEFQYMMYADRDIVPYLQDIWDNILSKTEIMLVICGSHISVMDNLSEYSEPLYGRFTRHMRIHSLPFDIVRDDDFIGSLERYSIHGGVPKYMELMGKGPLDKTLKNDVLDPSSMMSDDVLFMLNDEVREANSYMSIMRSIANGNHRPRDIASNLQIKETSMGKPLKTLMDMGLIRREAPVTDDPDRSKSAMYVFDDNYSSFWFKFIAPFRSAIEMREFDGAIAYWRNHFYEHHVAFVFEEICRRAVYGLSDEIGFIPRKVGRYWNGDCEIDLMALDTDGKRAFVAECKCRKEKPVGSHELSELMDKVSGIKELKGYKIAYGLFSITGFTDDVREKGILLIDRGKRVL